MIIEEEKNKTTTFESLNDGDIYRYGSIYFLKIPRCSVGEYNYNAYDLVNNDYCYFGEYRDVILVKAKLVIE